MTWHQFDRCAVCDGTIRHLADFRRDEHGEWEHVWPPADEHDPIALAEVLEARQQHPAGRGKAD